MAPVVVDPKRIKAFPSEQAFESWLAKHHDREPELWIRIYKKASGISTITPTQAIDVCLCWGWIDGQRKGYDELSFLQRYTPRRAKSVWSQINRDNVARLIEQKRMTPHGLRHVEDAKADGRWAAAYRVNRSMAMPDELMRAIQADEKALAAFEQLGSQERFHMAFHFGNLRTAAGREKKIASYLKALRGAPAKSPGSPKRSPPRAPQPTSERARAPRRAGRRSP